MPASPDPDFILRGNDGPLTSVVFTPDNGSLLSGSQGGVIRGWCLRSRRPLYRLDAHQGRSVLTLIPIDGDRLLSQGRDGNLHLWQSDNIGWIKIDSVPCSSLGFCPAVTLNINGSTAVAMSADDHSQVNVYAINGNEKICTLRPQTHHGMCMQMATVSRHSNDSAILVGYEDGSISLWDVKQAAELSRVRYHDESVLGMDYNTNVCRGASSSVDDKLHAWKVSDELQICEEQVILITNPGINTVRWRTDGRLLAAAGWDGRVRLFGGRKLKPLAVLTCHTDSVQCAAFSTDHSLVAGSKDGLISMWSVYK